MSVRIQTSPKALKDKRELLHKLSLTYNKGADVERRQGGKVKNKFATLQKG